MRSRENHCRAVDRIALHRRQGLIRLIERKGRDPRLELNLGSQFQKIAGIGARHVRDAPNLPLAPQQLVIIELRYAIKMNRIDGDYSAFAQAAERGDHHLPAGSERNCPIKFHGRLLRLRANPLRSQRFRQFAMRLSPRRHINLAPPRAQHFNRKMRRRAEAEQPNFFSGLNPSHPQASKSDNAGAQQRRRPNGIKRRGQRKNKIRIRHHEFGIPTIDVVPSKCRGVAKILEIVPAVPAVAVGRAQPRHANPRAHPKRAGRAAQELRPQSDAQE